MGERLRDHLALTPARRTLFREHRVRVLFEDNHVLCVAKPAGLLSQAGPQGAVALPAVLDAYRRENEGKPGHAYVGLVHRLDRNVSGAMVVAKTSKAAARLSALFRDRADDLQKAYLAWVERTPAEGEGTLVHVLRREKGITKPAAEGDPDGRKAHLRYVVEGSGPRSSRLRVDLVTGLPHQIRCQLSLAGHPLLGDRKYRGPSWKRPALHAARLAFPHPVRDLRVEVAAPVPKDLVRLDERQAIEPPLD